jgi:hypothetical protein
LEDMEDLEELRLFIEIGVYMNVPLEELEDLRNYLVKCGFMWWSYCEFGGIAHSLEKAHRSSLPTLGSTLACPFWIR